ncbi:MAG TPA: Ldh family oxidoreductase [Candidatus Elarobacter sp.]|jgi:LDH2 family malate/lactate/ureidoglycolate dehydrogenase
MADLLTSEYRLADERALEAFTAAALEKVGVAPADAAIVGEVLVASDLRGIESHGTARLEQFYVDRIRNGALVPAPATTIVRETPTSILIDAGNGLGHPAAYRAMEAVLAKAEQQGAAFGTVRNSNHFGIAGFYAMMALERDMIGIASTNTVRLGVPTNGRDLMLGTNPLAFAIPAKNEPAFVLDFATTTVPKGKLEVYQRKGKALQPGWAIDKDGNETLDPVIGMNGGLLPLGGYGTDNGGHKGYGLGLLVEILTGVLAGGAFGNDLPLPSDPPLPGKVSHFFAAFAIDGFRDVEAFKADMDVELRAFKDSAKAPGCERIYVAGEIEHEKTLYNREHGVPVHVKVWESLQRLSSELGIPLAEKPAH